MRPIDMIGEGAIGNQPSVMQMTQLLTQRAPRASPSAGAAALAVRRPQLRASPAIEDRMRYQWAEGPSSRRVQQPSSAAQEPTFDG